MQLLNAPWLRREGDGGAVPWQDVLDLGQVIKPNVPKMSAVEKQQYEQYCTSILTSADGDAVKKVREQGGFRAAFAKVLALDLKTMLLSAAKGSKLRSTSAKEKAARIAENKQVHYLATRLKQAKVELTKMEQYCSKLSSNLFTPCHLLEPPNANVTRIIEESNKSIGLTSSRMSSESYSQKQQERAAKQVVVSHHLQRLLVSRKKKIISVLEEAFAYCSSSKDFGARKRAIEAVLMEMKVTRTSQSTPMLALEVEEFYGSSLKASTILQYFNFFCKHGYFELDQRGHYYRTGLWDDQDIGIRSREWLLKTNNVTTSLFANFLQNDLYRDKKEMQRASEMYNLNNMSEERARFFLHRLGFTYGSGHAQKGYFTDTRTKRDVSEAQKIFLKGTLQEELRQPLFMYVPIGEIPAALLQAPLFDKRVVDTSKLWQNEGATFWHNGIEYFQLHVDRLPNVKTREAFGSRGGLYNNEFLKSLEDVCEQQDTFKQAIAEAAARCESDDEQEAQLATAIQPVCRISRARYNILRRLKWLFVPPNTALENACLSKCGHFATGEAWSALSLALPLNKQQCERFLATACTLIVAFLTGITTGANSIIEQIRDIKLPFSVELNALRDGNAAKNAFSSDEAVTALLKKAALSREHSRAGIEVAPCHTGQHKSGEKCKCQFPLLVQYHDESAYKQISYCSQEWSDGNGVRLKSKGTGGSVMVAGFAEEENPFPTISNEDRAKINELRASKGIVALFDNPLLRFFEFGEQREGYFTHIEVKAQMHDMLDVMAITNPNIQIQAMVDNSGTHNSKGLDGLNEVTMSLGYGGAQPPMHSTKLTIGCIGEREIEAKVKHPVSKEMIDYRLNEGDEQHLVFSADGDQLPPFYDLLCPKIDLLLPTVYTKSTFVARKRSYDEKACKYVKVSVQKPGATGPTALALEAENKKLKRDEKKKVKQQDPQKSVNVWKKEIATPSASKDVTELMEVQAADGGDGEEEEAGEEQGGGGEEEQEMVVEVELATGAPTPSSSTMKINKRKRSKRKGKGGKHAESDESEEEEGDEEEDDENETGEDGMQKLSSCELIRLAEHVLSELENEDDEENLVGEVFGEAVTNVENYSETILEPMDLGTVKKKLKGGDYGDNPSLFIHDVRLIFTNCMLFNGKGWYYNLAKSTLKCFDDACAGTLLLPSTKRNKSGGVRQRPSNRASPKSKEIKDRGGSGGRGKKKTMHAGGDEEEAQFQVVEIGYMNKPVGLLHALFRRGLYKVGMHKARKGKELDKYMEKNNGNKPDASMEADTVLGSCSDFKSEASIVFKVLRNAGDMANNTPVSCPEFSPLELDWGASKLTQKRHFPHSSTADFYNNIRLTFTPEYLPPKTTRAFFRKCRDYGRSYMELFNAGFNGRSLEGEQLRDAKLIEKFRGNVKSHRNMKDFEKGLLMSLVREAAVERGEASSGDKQGDEDDDEEELYA